MRAYYFDNLSGDQSLPHDSGRSVLESTLASIGVAHWSIPVEHNEPEIEKVARERGYKNRDTLSVSKEGLGDAYESKMKGFYTEHMHEDEEIRYILSGSGFFDLREHPTEEWIRVHVTPGDLLVLPAGIYHRFTLDEGNAVETLRLFKDAPKWMAHNRGAEADANPHRMQYLESIRPDVIAVV